jgi:hypothetical protein
MSGGTCWTVSWTQRAEEFYGGPTQSIARSVSSHPKLRLLPSIPSEDTSDDVDLNSLAPP